ncbi:MAG: hypothetical protein V4559_02525 [Pseudomonadota bacterium]
MRKILGAMAVLLLAAHVLPASAEVPVLASQAIDNEQVTAWDITLKPGQTGPMTPTDRDAVILYLEGGTIKSDSASGTATVARAFGDAVFVPKGSRLRETLVKGGPVHEVMVWLKDTKPKTIANPTKYPTAWPRPGAVKTLENDRVVAWHYSWLQGRPAPMHFHIHQQVIGERYTGAIKTIMEDGKVTMGPTEAGQIRFTEPGRMHSEEWGAGKVSAVILELK